MSIFNVIVYEDGFGVVLNFNQNQLDDDFSGFDLSSAETGNLEQVVEEQVKKAILDKSIFREGNCRYVFRVFLVPNSRGRVRFEMAVACQGLPLHQYESTETFPNYDEALTAIRQYAQNWVANQSIGSK